MQTLWVWKPDVAMPTPYLERNPLSCTTLLAYWYRFVSPLYVSLSLSLSPADTHIPPYLDRRPLVVLQKKRRETFWTAELVTV